MAYKAKTKKLGDNGRPGLEVDEKQITELARINCTMREIAAVCGCSVDYLEDHFIDLIEAGRQYGKQSLRRAQWQKAQDGNPTMLVWLGKQWLDQKDKIEHSEEDPLVSFIKSLQGMSDEELKKLSEGK